MTIKLKVLVLFSFFTLAVAQQGLSQRVECTLQQVLPHLLNGTCTGWNPESTIALQPMRGSDGDWTGAISLGINVGLIEIVATQYGSERLYVLRSTADWYNVSEFDTSEATGRLVFDRSDIAKPTDADITILRKAHNLLVSTPIWDRSDDRNCNNDEPGVLGLYCALVRATIEEMGRFYHRQPALQRVRRVIDEVWNDRTRGHRLMDFNNHPETTLEEVLEVIEMAEELTRDEMD